MTVLLKQRFNEVTSQLEQLEATKRYETSGVIVGEFVDQEMFLGWKIRSKGLIASACGKDSEHYAAFEKAEKAYFGATSHYILKHLKAVFVAAREDFEAGYLNQSAAEMNEWINAASALDLLGMGHAGKKVICKRARAGLIKTRAELLLRDGQIINTREIFPGFWWADGEAALEQNWITGDFDTWIDKKVHMEAFGVTFLSFDINRTKPTQPLSRMLKEPKAMTQGTHVFIGHGRSLVWRELKDFIKDELHLAVDEFNRIETAGLATANRLQQMMNDAAFAFLILTAEDEQADGKSNARMNVVHELGLFQGQLNFERAIILLEDGCEEFSNIYGLGQLRFPQGNIGSLFERVRRVLTREKIIT